MTTTAKSRFTDAEIDRAVRDETLFKSVTPPKPAIDALGRALFEIELNDVLHMPNEDAEFAKMQDYSRARLCRNAAWILGRLELAGYRLFDIDKVNRVLATEPARRMGEPK